MTKCCRWMSTASFPTGDYTAAEVHALVLHWATVRDYKHRMPVLVRCADLEVAVRKLPYSERQAVIWYGVIGHTHAEVAKLVGVSEKTAWARWHRGLGYLLTLMNGGEL